VASAPATTAHTTQAPASAAAKSTSKRRLGGASDPSQSVDTLSGAQHRVTAHDTLRGIARRAGARTEPQAQRLMMAIFRANPEAFDGNINLLHLGAVLTIPGPEAVAAVDGTEARKEVRAQMTAWRLDGRPTTTHRVAVAAPAVAVADVPRTALPSSPGVTAPASDPTADALKSRVASLEQALDTMRQQLTQLTGHNAAAPAAPATPAPQATQPTATAPQVQLMREVPPAVSNPPAPASPTVASGSHTTLMATMAAALALLLGGFAFIRRRALRNKSNFAEGVTAATAEVVNTAGAAAIPSKADVSPKPKTVQSQRITVREIPDPPIVSEIKQRELGEESDQNMFVDTEALERSYLDSLGIDMHGKDDCIGQKHIEQGHLDEELSSEMADSTQELPDNETLLNDTASLHHTAPLHHSASFDTLSREATGTRDATGLDTVAIDTSDLEAELRDADPTPWCWTTCKRTPTPSTTTTRTWLATRCRLTARCRPGSA
jgi:FimV-like protein